MSAGPQEISPGAIAAMIVAAGGSTRMGRSKTLLEWGDRPLVRHVCEIALESACDRVFIVLGHDAENTRDELEGLDVEVIPHAGWRDGMGSSIAAGIAGIEAYTPPASAWGGVILMLGDQPFANATLLDELLAQRRESGKAVVACRYRNTLGPPVCFDRSLFVRLRALAGDQGAKSLLVENPDQVVSVAFPDGELDLDTPEDYDVALGKLRARLEEPPDSFDGP